MTLNEAKKLQKEREKKAFIGFCLSILFIAFGTFMLVEFTPVFEISSGFYLIPIGLLALAVKNTKIYLFLTAREFRGKIVRLDLYPVKTGNIKGEHTYETRQGEALEAAIYIDNGKCTKLKEMYATPIVYSLSVGMSVALLRFIDQPIIIEEN